MNTHHFKLSFFRLHLYILKFELHITNRVSDNLKDPVARAIEKFKTRPSVLIIKDKIFQRNKFSFTEVSQSKIEKEIKNLNVK